MPNKSKCHGFRSGGGGGNNSLIITVTIYSPTNACKCLQCEILHCHSFSSLSYDRSKASSKASSPHSAIQSFLLQMRVPSPFLKVIQ